MQKHTPGPWYSTVTNRHGGTNQFYASVMSAATKNWVATGVRTKDAPLIAAAPDLLEAAKDIYAAYGTYAGMDAQWRARLETLSVAIAKAEGR